MLAPYINKTAFIKKISEKNGLKEEDILFKHLITKIKKSIKKALDIPNSGNFNILELDLKRGTDLWS